MADEGGVPCRITLVVAVRPGRCHLRECLSHDRSLHTHASQFRMTIRIDRNYTHSTPQSRLTGNGDGVFLRGREGILGVDLIGRQLLARACTPLS